MPGEKVFCFWRYNVELTVPQAQQIYGATQDPVIWHNHWNNALLRESDVDGMIMPLRGLKEANVYFYNEQLYSHERLCEEVKTMRHNFELLEAMFIRHVTSQTNELGNDHEDV